MQMILKRLILFIGAVAFATSCASKVIEEPLPAANHTESQNQAKPSARQAPVLQMPQDMQGQIKPSSIKTVKLPDGGMVPLIFLPFGHGGQQQANPTPTQGTPGSTQPITGGKP